MTIIKPNQFGIAVILEVVLIAVVVVAIGAVVALAYHRKTGTSLVSAVVPPKLSLSTNCPYHDPDLCRFLNNTNQFKDGVTTTSAGNADQGTATFVLDVHQNTQVVVDTNGHEVSNVITIGNTIYTKSYSDNTWQVQTLTADQQAQHSQDVSQYSFKSTSDLDNPTTTQFKKLDKEACGSLTCFKYQITQAGISGVDDIWFDTNDYKLRQSQATVNGSVVNLTYSYNNASVSIPSPIKG